MLVLALAAVVAVVPENPEKSANPEATKVLRILKTLNTLFMVSSLLITMGFCMQSYRFTGLEPNLGAGV